MDEKLTYNLPFVIPEVTSFPSIASLLSILSHYEQASPWIHNNFVNLYGFQYADHPLMLRFSSERIRQLCPFVNYNRFGKECVAYFGVEKFLRDFISMGYYILIEYDRFFLPYCDDFQKEHTFHQLFIYGIDTEKNVFHVADFFHENKFSQQIVGADILGESINYSVHNNVRFFAETLKFNHAVYTFDMNLFVKDLNDFLHSKRTVLPYEDNYFNSYEKSNVMCETMMYGLSNYDFIIQNISNMMEQKPSYITLRTFHVIYDHKILMANRLSFLNMLGVITDFDSIKERYEDIKRLSLQSRNLIIKYKLSQDQFILDKLLQKMETIKKEEKLAVIQLLESLGTTTTL